MDDVLIKIPQTKHNVYVPKGNSPYQPLPVPTPYADSPRLCERIETILKDVAKKVFGFLIDSGTVLYFSANRTATAIVSTRLPVGLKRISQKMLGFVAALGLVSSLAISKQVDSPFKIYMSVKGTDGKEELKPICVLPDADYIFDFNGETYAVTVDDVLGFGIWGENNQSLATLPMNENMYNIISHLAAVDGNPNELSPYDVYLATTKTLNLPNHKVTKVHYDDMPPNEVEIKIEQFKNGQVISYCNVNALDQPTVYYK